MEHNNEQTAELAWKAYLKHELEVATPILTQLGYELDEYQPHMSGERYLMQAVTTAHGKKLILIGKRKNDEKKVIIKVTSDAKGAEEIIHERICRKLLQEINFAYQTFFSPNELVFMQADQYTISIQEFLEQKCSFLERSLEEQFEIALRAFKAQESAHATTHKHLKTIGKTFGSKGSNDYWKMFADFSTQIKKRLPQDDSLVKLLDESTKYLHKNIQTVEQYCGFLTHVDFVPHNFRVINNVIYLLDHSSLRFGNKYEGWARFLNFMTLYNPPLEQALIQYVRDNRSREESHALKLMRIFRLGEIIWYYANILEKTTGNLRLLEEKRITFWSNVLQATLNDAPLDDHVRKEYTASRDSLRSEDEKKRQIGLH